MNCREQEAKDARCNEPTSTNIFWNKVHNGNLGRHRTAGDPNSPYFEDDEPELYDCPYCDRETEVPTGSCWGFECTNCGKTIHIG